MEVQFTPFELVPHVALSAVIARNIPNLGDHVIHTQARDVDNVTEVQLIPSGLIAPILVARVEDDAILIAPATAQKIPSSGDHVMADQYVVLGKVRAVHVTPSGLVAAVAVVVE